MLCCGTRQNPDFRTFRKISFKNRGHYSYIGSWAGGRRREGEGEVGGGEGRRGRGEAGVGGGRWERIGRMEEGWRGEGAEGEGYFALASALKK